MIEAKPLSRSFSYNGVKLPDPDPRMTVEEVKSLYSHQYPELATAAVTGPEANGTHGLQLRQGDWDERVNSEPPSY
jgi:PRTRC genetic system protein C